MGWTNSHLHEFIVGEHSYSDPEFEIDEARSEYRYRLARLAPRVRNTITYLYDGGSFDPEHFDLDEVNHLLRKIDLRPRW